MCVRPAARSSFFTLAIEARPEKTSETGQSRPCRVSTGLPSYVRKDGPPSESRTNSGDRCAKSTFWGASGDAAAAREKEAATTPRASLSAERIAKPQSSSAAPAGAGALDGDRPVV